MGINNDTSDLLYVTNSCNSSTGNTWLNCEEEKVESKKKYERETWSKQKIEAFRKCSARLKVKELVDKHGQPNSVIQIKNKLRNLKDLYKQAKDNNKIGASLRYSPSI